MYRNMSGFIHSQPYQLPITNLMELSRAKLEFIQKSKLRNKFLQHLYIAFKFSITGKSVRKHIYKEGGVIRIADLNCRFINFKTAEFQSIFPVRKRASSFLFFHNTSLSSDCQCSFVQSKTTFPELPLFMASKPFSKSRTSK